MGYPQKQYAPSVPRPTVWPVKTLRQSLWICRFQTTHLPLYHNRHPADRCIQTLYILHLKHGQFLPDFLKPGSFSPDFPQWYRKPAIPAHTESLPQPRRLLHCCHSRIDRELSLSFHIGCRSDLPPAEQPFPSKPFPECLLPVLFSLLFSVSVLFYITLS